MTESEESTAPPPSKAEIIRQVAQALQERRKLRGLTLEKVAQNLKIRLFYLQAMEKGEWDQLPGEVYVRGFMKRYAAFLGLDGEKLMAPYIALAEPMGAKPNKEETFQSKTSDISRTTLIWLVVAAVLLIGLFKFIRQAQVAPPQPPSPQQAAASPAPVTATEPVEKPDSAAVPAVSHTLAVFSPFPLWLRVVAEDRNFEGFIPQAATWTWKGNGRVSVRLGHSRQVSLVFDGRPVSLAENQKKIDLP